MRAPLPNTVVVPRWRHRRRSGWAALAAEMMRGWRSLGGGPTRATRDRDPAKIAADSAAGALGLARCGGAPESRAGQRAGDQSADRAAVAAAVRRGRRGRPAEGCAAAGAQEAHRAGEGGGDRECDVADDARGRDALERAHVGEAPAGESGYGASLSGKRTIWRPTASRRSSSAVIHSS